MSDAIALYKPTYIAEYTINNQLRSVPLPVESVQQMKDLRKDIRNEKLDLELEDQVIKGSRLIRFYQSQPRNEFDYLIGAIPDEVMRDYFVLFRKRRLAECKPAGIKVLRRIYQKEVLKIGEQDLVPAEDVQTILKLLEPYFWK